MPTPDETAFPPSPPTDIPARSLFASCPPEEEREAHASRAQSHDENEDTTAGAERAQLEGHAIAQEPTPEPETHTTPTEGSSQPQSQGKERAVTDPVARPNPPSPVASPDTTAETDMHAQSSSSTNPPVTFPPQYLDFAPNKDRVSHVNMISSASLTHLRQLLPSTTSSFLRPGSKFKGTQQSDRQIYDVQVEIKDVDMAESSLCGYLRIQGLLGCPATITASDANLTLTRPH